MKLAAAASPSLEKQDLDLLILDKRVARCALLLCCAGRPVPSAGACERTAMLARALKRAGSGSTAFAGSGFSASRLLRGQQTWQRRCLCSGADEPDVDMSMQRYTSNLRLTRDERPPMRSASTADDAFEPVNDEQLAPAFASLRQRVPEQHYAPQRSSSSISSSCRGKRGS